jgi:hypothetical protein
MTCDSKINLLLSYNVTLLHIKINDNSFFVCLNHACFLIIIVWKIKGNLYKLWIISDITVTRIQYCSEKSNNSTVVYMYLWNQERKLRQISCIKETAKIHLKWHQRLEKFVSITSIYISGCCEIKQKQLNAVAGWWFKSGDC